MGVSPQAVAHALNGIGRISPATRAKVLRAAEELGYRPNPLARALVTGRTNLLALWTQGGLEPHHVMVVNALQPLVGPSAYNLIITDVVNYLDTKDKRERFGREAISFAPSAWPTDGIFAHDVPKIPDWILDEQGANAPAIICMGLDHSFFRPSARLDAVLIDLYPGAVAAVRHLVATRRRVALLMQLQFQRYRDPRYVAYETVMSEAGRALEMIAVPEYEDIYAGARHAFLEHVAAYGCPNAVFCGNDVQAIVVHRALHEMGRRVPDDVALIGCDGSEASVHHLPSISTIVQPFATMGRLAWEAMQRRLQDPTVPVQQTVLEAAFEVRESSA